MSGKDALAKQLGGKQPPKGLVATVDDADLERLAQTIHDARRRQGEALAASGEQALRIIPGILRRPVKKMLGM
jgi:predicted metal-dependent phosphoesterase TrpH